MARHLTYVYLLPPAWLNPSCRLNYQDFYFILLMQLILFLMFSSKIWIKHVNNYDKAVSCDMSLGILTEIWRCRWVSEVYLEHLPQIFLSHTPSTSNNKDHERAKSIYNRGSMGKIDVCEFIRLLSWTHHFYLFFKLATVPLWYEWIRELISSWGSKSI